MSWSSCGQTPKDSWLGMLWNIECRMARYVHNRLILTALINLTVLYLAMVKLAINDSLKAIDIIMNYHYYYCC